MYFRIDWFDPLTIQGTLKNLLQHHSSKASILWHSAFFIVQLSHWYISTGKARALTIRNFIGKVVSLKNVPLKIKTWAWPSAWSALWDLGPSACSVSKSCPTLCDPLNYRPPGSSVHEYTQASILKWVAISFSRGSSWLRDWTQVCLLCLLHW